MAIVSKRLRKSSSYKRVGGWGRYRFDYFLSVSDAAFYAAGYRMPEQEVIDNEYNLFV